MSVLEWLAMQWSQAWPDPAFWLFILVCASLFVVLMVWITKTGKQPDAEFSDLPWQGWDDVRSEAVETAEHDCGDAVFYLTQKGFYITGVNRSAKLLHISTPGHIAMDVSAPYDSRVPRKGFLHNVTRICTHGEREASRH